MSDAATVSALLAGLAALATALMTGMVRILRELEKISNGKMSRIDDNLSRIIKIERAHLSASGRIYRALESLRSWPLDSSDARKSPRAKLVKRGETSEVSAPGPSAQARIGGEPKYARSGGNAATMDGGKDHGG